VEERHGEEGHVLCARRDGQCMRAFPEPLRCSVCVCEPAGEMLTNMLLLQCCVLCCVTHPNIGTPVCLPMFDLFALRWSSHHPSTTIPDCLPDSVPLPPAPYPRPPQSTSSSVQVPHSGDPPLRVRPT